MKPMTPSGTRTRLISSPDGRRVVSTVSPTGSGRAAISRRPIAMVSIRASVRVSRSRKARAAPPARARSRSTRLASRMAAVFSSSPRAICARASFFVRVEQRASARAAARAARAFVSTSVFTSMSALRPTLEDHQVVPVDHFVEALVPQALLDLAGLSSEDTPNLGRVEIHQTPGELAVTLDLTGHRHHRAGGEVALDPDD